MSRDYKNSNARARSEVQVHPRAASRSMLPGIFIGLAVGVLIATAVAFFVNMQTSFNFKNTEQKENASAREDIAILNPPGVGRLSESVVMTDVPIEKVTSETLGKVNEKAPSETKEEVQREPSPEETALLAPPEKPVDYDFYKILPSMEEALNEPPAPALPKVTSTENPLAAAQATPEVPVTPPPVRASRIYLQFASFSRASEADNLKARLLLNGIDAHIQQAQVTGRGLMHRVRLGPFSSDAEADRMRAQLNSQQGITSTIVRD